MKSIVRTKLLPLAIATLLASSPILAQDTSSSISGRVLDANGQPVAGATVQIVHEPSGTTKTTTTDADGRYAAQGLRVGGPFDVTVSKSGMHGIERNNVYLQLAQDTAINLSLGQQAKDLQSITVTANALSQTFNSDNKGMATNISQRELENTPTPGRSIQDIARLDPRIVISDRDRGQFSALGQNFRYNNISIDTVNAGDPFGLEDNGLASVGTPISQDTIQEYNISTVNYDVSARRGVGANINAVTKSGTNNFHGSVYYAFQNTSDMLGKIQNSSGKTAQYTGFDRNWTGGMTLGGPIIKDKLFFFASYEQAKKTGVGATYGPSDSNATNTVQGLTQAQVDAIAAAARQLGLNPGDSTSKFDLLDKRTLVKLDWNITDGHRASLRYTRTKENQPIINDGGASYINLSSNWFYKNRDSKSYALNLYDDWNSTFSTEASVSYATYDQARGPAVGGAQPYVQVYPSYGIDNNPNVAFGTDYSSMVNVLNVKSWNAYMAGTLFLDQHTVKGGVDFQKDDYFNAFLQRYYGTYQFRSLQDFENGAWYNYQLKLPVNGNDPRDPNSVAARYAITQYGAFLQDSWQITDRLSMQYGVRLDIPLTSDRPLLNECFLATPGVSFTARNADGSVRCQAAKGGFGYSNTTTINGNRVVQPRMSFNYSFDTERSTQLRGGAGLFIANNPSVWISNSYANPGINVGTWNVTDANRLLPGVNLPGVGLKPAPSYDPNNPIIPGNSAILGSSNAKMAVDTVDPNFRQPTVWKMSLALDRELPWMGIVGSLEWVHLKARDAIFYQNLNIGDPNSHLTPDGFAQDGRNLYWGTVSKTALSTERVNANPAFDRSVTRLTNTSKGRSDNVTLSFKKAFANDWAAMVGFSWNKTTDVNPVPSSTASSNYQGNFWVNPNVAKESTSLYSIPKRVLASVTWSHRFFGNYATTVGAVFDGHSGSPYSWSFGNDINGDGYARDLAYIPSSLTDVEWNTKVTDAQKQQFMDFINNDKYLSKHKGEIAGVNGARAPWISQLDLSFRQEIPGIFKGNKGILSLDVFNFTNMLNKKWGVEHRATFPGYRNLANVTGIDPVTGKYVYDISGAAYQKNGGYSPASLPINESLSPSQRWSLLLTARYTF